MPVLRIFLLIGLLLIGGIGLTAAPASALGTAASSRTSWLQAPCTPLGCPARQSQPWTHSFGFASAVVAAVLLARRDGDRLFARR